MITGGDKALYQWLRSQIPGYRSPICVLQDITIYDKRKGHGREALRMFHRHAADGGAHFAILLVGTSDEDYCEGLLWRRKFYGSEGWVSLKRPKDPHLKRDWMYRKLGNPLPGFKVEEPTLVFKPTAG